MVDAARARIFAFDEAADPGQELVELTDFANPGRRLKDSELFSESRPSRRAETGNQSGGAIHSGGATDDHRDHHIAHWDTEFAHAVIAEVERVIRDHDLASVLLVASPKMLGVLRKLDGVLRQPGTTLTEMTGGLTHLSVPQLHDQLAAMHLVPPRARLAVAR